jgi:hypothetical protein
MEYVKRVNWAAKFLLIGLGGLMLAERTRANSNNGLADNFYRVIVDRNPFGLQPPRVNPPTVPTNKPPDKVDVKFTGITSDSTGKKAWLVIPTPPNKRDQHPQYLSLREQESQGDIQVLEIDDKENTVKIANAGSTVVLTFKDHGFPTPTMVAMAMPGNVLPAGVPGALPAPGIVQLPTTPASGIRTAGVTPASAANDALAARYGLQTTSPANVAGMTPVRTIPTRNLRTTGEPQAQGVETPVDPAVQRLLMEAQALDAKQRGLAFPPLPPMPGGGK